MRIGIDLGGTKIEGILLDDSGEEVQRFRRPTPVGQGYEAIVQTMSEMALELGQRARTPCTVGICIPGGISPSSGLVRNSNTVCLNGMPLQQDLENATGIEVRLENDANCFALSEATDGAASGHSVVFGVIMGTGVGGGWVINGRTHRGRQHISGEWGHNILVPGGKRCYCGREGCVETYLSGPGLLSGWPDRELRLRNVPDLLTLYREGHEAATAIMVEFLDHFGRALAGVINIMDPDIIVLGGGLSNIDELYSAGREQVKKYVFNDSFSTPIVRNVHGDSSGVRGAAWLWGGSPGSRASQVKSRESGQGN